MKKKKLPAVLLALFLMGVVLGGCGGTPSLREEEQEAGPVDASQAGAAQAGGLEDGENADTGDAALDNPRNQDGIGPRELLAVSFGTSYNDSRRLAIGGIEAALEDAFPAWSVRRGFTSQIILDHVAGRDGVWMDNVGQALDRAAANGVKTLVIQPTHLMNGFEYGDLAAEAGQRSDAFERMAVGAPLLTSDRDFDRVAEAIRREMAAYDDGETAICFMGHGTEADANGVYEKLQAVLRDKGLAHYYIGTVEASPGLEDVLAAVQAGRYQKVVLEPLMIVAGDHASNDMAGEDPDSWKSVFEAAGYPVTCVLRGLGEWEDIQAIFVDHARAAMESIGVEPDYTGGDSPSQASDNPAQTADSTPQAGDTPAQAADSGIQAGNNPAQAMEPRPVYAAALREGTYPVTVESSSSMFRVTDCALTVSGGQMTAVMTMGGTGYLYVYPGTPEEAASAAAADRIPFAEGPDGVHTFTFPVPALDVEVPCAAYSRNREQWYGRTLMFRADSLPGEAFAEGSPSEGLGLTDGLYTAQVTLSGGSGRASVDPLAELRVTGGTAWAVIRWNSEHYDYMVVNGERLVPAAQGDGVSVFEIPVAALDRPLPVLADTTAMSQPHEIAYTLLFHVIQTAEDDEAVADG